MARLAGALAEHGIQPGDRVGLLLYNTPAFVLAYFAVLSLGAVVVPLNTRLTGPEVERILQDADARLLISDPEFEAAFPIHIPIRDVDALLETTESDPPGLAPHPVSPNTLAALIYTSGTTGRPKGVMLSHGNLAADAQANIAVIEATAADRLITVSPLFHVFGQTNILISALWAGASVVLIPKFSPRRILEAIGRYHVTFMAAVPTMYLMMLSLLRERAAQFDLSSLRVCHSGAASLAVETFREIESAFGVPVQEGYGLSEASSIVCSNPLHGARKPGSVGLPLLGVQLRVVADADPCTISSPAIPSDVLAGPLDDPIHASAGARWRLRPALLGSCMYKAPS